MRYDECIWYSEYEYGDCRGARAWHFEWDDGEQFTVCEEHRDIEYAGIAGLRRIPCRTD